MGLDVYLYRYENFADTRARQEQYDEAAQRAWDAAGPYDSLTEDQKNAVRAELSSVAVSLELNTYGGDDTGKQSIDFPSAAYPDHLFRVGYFRSSYNDGGINSVARKLGVPTLYEIFHPGDEYAVQPDWAKCLANAESAYAEWSAEVEKTEGTSILRIPLRLVGGCGSPSTEREALDIVLKERARGSSFESYFNGNGEFFVKGINVKAIMPGTCSFLVAREPCVYVAYGNDEGYAFYLQALEIVIETCKHVLSQPDPEKYILHWSS